MIIGINAINIKSFGGESHLSNIINNLDEKYFSNKVKKIYIWCSSNLKEKIKVNKKIIFLTVNTLGIKSFYWNIFTFRGEIKKFKCDIIFLPSGINYYYNCKTVILFQNLIPFDNNEMIKYGLSFTVVKLFLLNILYKFSLKCSSGVIYLNNYSKRLIENRYGYKKKNYKIIPHGFSKKFFSTKINKIDTSFNILYVSSIDFYKNHITLLKSLKELSKNKYRVKLFIVGDYLNKDIQNKFEALFKKDKILKDKVVHHKNLTEKDIIKLMENMDLVCFPSSCESIGLGLIEGMASHLPVICSKGSTFMETFQIKKYTFKTYDVENLTKLIKQLINNPKERKLLAKNTTKIAKNFTWDRSSKETFNFIYECFKN